MIFRILVSDDEADPVGQHFGNPQIGAGFKNTVERVLREMCGSNIEIEWTFVDSHDTTIELLRRADIEWHIAILDVNWPRIGRAPADNVKPLLSTGLNRPETISIMLSVSPDVLLEYLYDVRAAAVRPHAVLSKGQIETPDVIRGVIEVGFSQRRRALRSLTRSVSFVSDMPANQLSSRSPINEVVVAELACMAIPSMVSATITTLSGGLSSAIVVRVDAGVRVERGILTRSVIMKIAQDVGELLEELRAHQELIGFFRDGQFAHIIGSEPFGFGGWSALAFEAVVGARTAAVQAVEVLADAIWSKIFAADVLARYVQNCMARPIEESDVVSYTGVTSTNVASWLSSRNGLLPGRRWQRVVDSAAALGMPEDSIALLREQGVRGLFGQQTRQFARTLVHGDLHSRNVLLSPHNDRVVWVDAASIRRSGVWCEDLARFATWIACGILSEDVRPIDDDAMVSAIRSSLLLEIGRSGPGWVGRLRACCLGSLDLFRRLWQEAQVSLDFDADWAMCVKAELLRASYSNDTFPVNVRRAALRAVLAGA